MSEVEDLLERIERRAEALVRENARLRDKIGDLDRKGEEMQKAIKDKDILINNLTEQNKILKLGNALTQKGDSTEIKLKINQLIRDIDKSLSLMTKL
jgi:cell division septum initiation protein DivIVA